QRTLDPGRGRALPARAPPRPTTPGRPGAVTPPAAMPPGAPAAKLPPATHVQPGPAGEDEIRLSDFPEAVDLRALVEWVAETLKINIAASDQLSGSVVINAPITVKKDKLLDLLNALLEQQGGYTIYY